MYGCFLKGVNYNTLNYGTNDAVTIALSIAYDNAVQAPLGSGVGSAIGRTLGDLASGVGA